VGEAERRRYPRAVAPETVVVAWQSGTRRSVSHMKSIGLGGVFVLTKHPVPIRSMVKVLMDLPFGEVRARAIVRRVMPTRGMAVEFMR
jgi:hypothetical protein